MKPTVLFALAISVSCGTPPRDDTARIWFEPHPFMSVAAMLDGCQMWHHQGVHCVRAQYENDANVRVYYDSVTPCGRWYGQAVVTRSKTTGVTARIRLGADCFRDKDGKSLDHKLTIVFAHEIGHAFGANHVPSKCGTLEEYVKEREGVDPGLDIIRHPDGELVCGTAIMNPIVPIGLPGPTHIDNLAFDLRDDYSVISCTLGRP